LSRAGQSIIHEIEASARDWGKLQALLCLPKENILEIVGGLFDRVDSQHRGSLTWIKFGEAMLLLCGKEFSELKLQELCLQYMVSPGSAISKVQFEELAVHGLFVVAQDELRSGDIVNNTGITRCVQRLKFLRMDLCSPGSLRNDVKTAAEFAKHTSSSPQVPPQEKTESNKSTSKRVGTRQQPAAWLPLASDGSAHRRMPIMMPSVVSSPALACLGRSLLDQ